MIPSAALDYIREYRDEDAEKVARMWRESAVAWPGGGPGGGEHATAARVREEQRDLNTLAALVAYRPDPQTGQECAVGYLTLYEYTSELDTAYVGILSAHPAWHGQGVGRDLLRLALERTVQLGYSRLDLNTWAGNLKAVPLYKKSGYFWVPDTTVKMENYLPLIFRLPAAQRFFEQADWYADLKRDLSIRPDDERRGNAQIYTYRWEHNGRALTVVIDRRAKGVAALETEGYAVSLEVDDPRVPVGGERTATWRIENRGDRPIAISVLSEGEDAIRCTTERSGVIERADAWSAPVGAERPAGALPTNRPANRIKSTVIVDGEALPLVAGTVVSQPLTIDLGHQRYLLPGVPATQWITLENPFDEPSSGTVRLSPSLGLEIDRREIEYQLEARSRMNVPLQLRIDAPGTLALRAQATVQLSGRELTTGVTSRDVFCGEIGELFVEQTEEYVRPCTDRFAVYIGLKPAGSWTVGFSVWARESGGSLLSHGASLGPPFVPSPLVNCTWTPRVERRGASVLVVLSADPPAYPGLTFERHLLISPSGIIRVTYRLTNAGSAPRALQVNSGTSVQLSEARCGTRAAAHLTTGLVVEDADRFPDWGESEYGKPERYGESWMCEFGDGWVGATIWTRALEAQAGWMTPDLILDVGRIESGQSAETDPIYVYAGQGDWKTARALWRQLVSPDGPRNVLDPRPAHRARLERFAFDTDRATTRVVVESERARPFSGEVRLEREAHTLARGAFEGVKVGAPAELAVDIDLPKRAEALETRLVLDHERTTETFDAPLLRVGMAGAPVRIEARREGDMQRVEIENGRLRLTVIPSQLARVAELSLRTADGEWQNQLHAPANAPDVFVWFNPWYGGLHPLLDVGGWHLGRNHKEVFTWSETERIGAHGVRWRGITCRTVVVGADVTGVRPANGLRLEVSYLTVGESNVLAIPVRVANGSSARVEGGLQIIAFLQPGGDRGKTLLHYERDGQVWTQKRVHGGPQVSSEAWCAVSGPTGSPAIGMVPGAMTARVGGFRDMGHEGAHPNLAFGLRLAPGETFESVGYVVLGDDVAETRRYKILRSAGALV